MIARALAYGFAGWLLEAAYTGAPRYSRAFGDLKVPFLPVYALGGLAVKAAAPRLKRTRLVGRAIVYGAALTGVELAACLLDRSTGGKEWSYENGACVDPKHSAAWTALALAVERLP